MTNAKLLIELPGVEAGSRECGGCESRGKSGYPTCIRYDVALFINPGNLSELRCPACIKAEEAVKAIGPKKEG